MSDEELYKQVTKRPHYANLYSFDMGDKLMLLEKVEKAMHQEINEQMLPKTRELSYFEKIRPIRPGEKVKGFVRYKVCD